MQFIAFVVHFDAVKIADVNYRGDTDGSGEKGWSHDGSLKSEGNDSRRNKNASRVFDERHESTCKLVSNAC